jgi:bifunctional non-homologous end joining protein LigD
MTLNTYQSKRRFDRTPEPAGKPRRGSGALRFVVQEHQASHHHYDFRLEMEGVLKSWAVPKGPSLNPADKRLAIQVEDHPFDYRAFEGTIPEGNYGAGTVMVWDEGTYEPGDSSNRASDEKRLLEQLDAGHLRFVLHGHKLRGQFSLVQFKDGKEKNWLLMKHRDEFANETDVLEKGRSAASQRSMEEIAEGASPRKTRHTNGKPEPRKRRKTAEGAAMPHQVKPMLATLVSQPFDRADWFFEIKWDGYRAVAETENAKVRLYSRNHISFETRFAPVFRSLAKLGHDAVLDGEIVALDAEGKSQFQLLQNYQRTGEGILVYYVFDLLYLDGEDLRSAPLRRRKELLAPLLKGLPNVGLSEHVEEHGIDFFKAAMRQKLEGIVAKNAGSAYREGTRSENWLKIKTRQQQEAIIAGFTEPRGSRHGLGALVLGIYEGNDLVYIGHAGGGFNAESLAEMRARLDPLVQKSCPFKVKPKTNAPVHWVKPTQVCEVTFQEWTQDGSMRQPIFLGLREDKPARSVSREVPKVLEDSDANTSHEKTSSRKPRGAANRKRETNQELPAGKFTNLDKVYWPKEGYTKGDLLNYYHDVAPFILPYLHDRPLSLHRHPNGIAGKSFFQKDVSGQPPPDWVQTASIASESAGKNISFVVCQDEATLLYVVNLGCIEMNPWNSRLGALDRPDYVVIDLDPQEIGFSQVVETALEVRKVIENAGGECHCKTSGKRGLHIFLPLGGRYDYAEARSFAERVARVVNSKLPDTTSILRQPAQRRARIYLDFLQNNRGQTLVAPYSLRPVEGATISTPLRWAEVKKTLDPTRFNLRTIRQRLDRVGDLWKPVLGRGIDLRKCLRTMKGAGDI